MLVNKNATDHGVIISYKPIKFKLCDGLKICQKKPVSCAQSKDTHKAPIVFNTTKKEKKQRKQKN